MIRSILRRATDRRWPAVKPGERISCSEVGRLLQWFLDDEVVDELTVGAIARHLDDCDRCGLEAETYRKIKFALASRRPDIPAEVVARLREFGAGLADGG